MIFGFLKKKKPGPKLRPKQEVEIELFNGETYETHFTRILEAQRRRIILRAPGTDRRPVLMEEGQTLTLTTIEDGSLYWFDATVLAAGEREFDITPPVKVQDQDLPGLEEGSRIHVPITVEYRAMNTAHAQVAQTYAITKEGLLLSTNLPIPPGTLLLLELEIPSAPDIKSRGRAVGSEKHPEDPRKHLSEIEYEDITDSDREAILRYALYHRRRQERIQDRLEQA